MTQARHNSLPAKWSSCCFLFAALLGLHSVQASAQVPAALSTLETAAQAAFNPAAKPFTSITLQGIVTWKQGSLEDQGTLTLKSSVDGSIAETWRLGTVPYSYAATSFSEGRSCTLSSSKGKAQPDRSSTCMQALPWFAPQVSTLLVGSALLGPTSIVVSAPTVSQQQATYTTSVVLTSLSQSSGSQPLPQTAVRISYDPVTFLPSHEDFDYTLDSDPRRIIAYRITFSDYRLDGGLMLPHRIQRYLQRTLQSDITVTSVTVE